MIMAAAATQVQRGVFRLGVRAAEMSKRLLTGAGGVWLAGALGCRLDGLAIGATSSAGNARGAGEANVRSAKAFNRAAFV